MIKHFARTLGALFFVLMVPTVNPLLAQANQLQASTTDTLLVGWLDGDVPARFQGTTFGVPWPQGMYNPMQQFTLTDSSGNEAPVQSWPLAYWPDGSMKWTAIAVAPSDFSGRQLRLQAGEYIPEQGIVVRKTASHIEVNTGVIRAVIARSGHVILPLLEREGKATALNGQLVMTRHGKPDPEEGGAIREWFTGAIDKVLVEQQGPVRTVVKIEGKHCNTEQRTWLPFVLRLYFYANSENIRMVHTIIYDGNEQHDFISGLGFRFSVPVQGELYNRHIRFVGNKGGVMAEAVQGLTGLRRFAGFENNRAQIEGREVPGREKLPRNIAEGLPYVPVFGDYTLFQGASNSFRITKRTREGHSWLNVAQGDRSQGVGYFGTPNGGMAFGVRNFWQSFPGQIDIRNGATDTAQVTLWLWAPQANPMDLRFYHDGMGQDNYAKQLEGLNITYEDYEPGFATPMGVARTSEIDLWALPATPSNEALADYASSVSQPPVLMVDRHHIENANVFGGLWAVRDNSDPFRKKLSDKLDWYFDYYKIQQEEHNWFGFWDYGDVMHSYDADRHVWKYDVGGFAWDNSELSTDLWLWYYFLHSGRADAFRFAEAMTRHTGEVDVHHIGPFAPLGSRHNVMHWGCSAKQLRISTAANRRFYYFLTADERVGDLLDEQAEAHRRLVDVVPYRKLANQQQYVTPGDGYAYLSFGTDWGALAAAWLTRWERSGDQSYYKRLLVSMESIAAQPKGFFSGGSAMNLETGRFMPAPRKQAVVSHLNAVFGLFEVCAELVQLIDLPSFEKAWLQYCTLYNAPEAEQKKHLGNAFQNNSLTQGHARLTAFAAMKTGNKELAQRAWSEFLGEYPDRTLSIPETSLIEPPVTLKPVREVRMVSTNHTALFGLSAIQCMKLLGGSQHD